MTTKPLTAAAAAAADANTLSLFSLYYSPFLFSSIIARRGCICTKLLPTKNTRPTNHSLQTQKKTKAAPRPSPSSLHPTMVVVLVILHLNFLPNQSFNLSIQPPTARKPTIPRIPSSLLVPVSRSHRDRNRCPGFLCVPSIRAAHLEEDKVTAALRPLAFIVRVTALGDLGQPVRARFQVQGRVDLGGGGERGGC